MCGWYEVVVLVEDGGIGVAAHGHGHVRMAVIVVSGRRAICMDNCRAATLRGRDSLPGTVARERYWAEPCARRLREQEACG